MNYYDKNYCVLIPGHKVKIYDPVYPEQEPLEGKIVKSPLIDNGIEILCNDTYVGAIHFTFENVPLPTLEIF